MLVFAVSFSNLPTRVRFPSASLIDTARCDVGFYSQALNLAGAGSIPARVTDDADGLALIRLS